MTMALSTTMPSTTINAEIETCCNSMPYAFNMPKVMATDAGMAMAETNETRSGNRSMVTRMTAPMAIPNSPKKSRMRSETTLGWSATMSSFTSGGRVA